MLWCLYTRLSCQCVSGSYITCKNINTGIRGFVVGISVSTWGRNPSRAMSTAGARMLARLAAPGHTQRPRRPRPGGRQHTARKPRSNPLHAHVCILSDSLQVQQHKYWDVTGCAHRLRRTGRALRSKRARRMRVAASKSYLRVFVMARDGGLRAAAARCGQRAPGDRYHTHREMALCGASAAGRRPPRCSPPPLAKSSRKRRKTGVLYANEHVPVSRCKKFVVPTHIETREKNMKLMLHYSKVIIGILTYLSINFF